MKKFQDLSLGCLIPPQEDARSAINAEKFNSLVESIREFGVIEPIVVRPTGDNQYEVVCGSRRVQAAAVVGLGKIPCIVKNMTDEECESVRLAENLDREDLNPIDEARFIDKLMQKYHLNESQVAERIRRTCAFVSQRLFLLKKDPVVREYVEKEVISTSVGRELLRLPTPEQRKKYAKFAADSGANQGMVRNWVNRELNDMAQQQGQFIPVQDTQQLEPIKPVVIQHPCGTCGRMGDLEALQIVRVCPDCINVIEEGRKAGIFTYEPVSEPEGSAPGASE